MKQYLNDIIYHHGEGIILRQPMSVYAKGKSHQLFKVKVVVCMCFCVVFISFQNMVDADAVVIDIQPSKLICKL